MKRLSRRPVSDEQKAQMGNQIHEQGAIEVFMSVATVSPLLRTRVLPQLKDQQDQLKDKKQDRRPKPEPEKLESGAQGDAGSASSTSAHAVKLLPIEGDPAKLKALTSRQQIASLLNHLGDGAEGDGEAKQIVMELLDSGVQPHSAIERVSEQLLHVLREQTLMEAGIFVGNERYRFFKGVLQNYAKIYAARKFIDKLPKLDQLGPDAGAERELFARVVAEEVLQIPQLLRQLRSSLSKMEFFNEDTGFKAYLEVRYHPQARILCELMLTRISRVFLCIVGSPFFLYFTEHELTHILRNCYLSVNSEIEIFLSVVLWLEHNWLERGDCAERILAEVHFALMPTWYLCTLDRSNRCNHFARVIHSPGVQRLIAAGLEDAITLKSKPRFSGAALHRQRKHQEERLLVRDWIVDTECSHHHKSHCEQFVYPTYDAFKEYLARIICCAPNCWRTFRPAQEVYRRDFRCCSLPHFN
uniref:GH10964p n=1 Tax=Drosophila melanogaster TaxID=7227 RepID=Q95U35_DROME|nr:GH10964p [Drosophila melanogaster]